jgi:hypothetical protein
VALLFAGIGWAQDTTKPAQKVPTLTGHHGANGVGIPSSKTW